MKLQKYLYIAFIFLLGSLLAPIAVAQSTTGALRGQVADPSGAAIPGATVIMTPATGSLVYR